MKQTRISIWLLCLPAPSQGLEAYPTVIFQGHMDMVVAAEGGKDFDLSALRPHHRFWNRVCRNRRRNDDACCLHSFSGNGTQDSDMKPYPAVFERSNCMDDRKHGDTCYIRFDRGDEIITGIREKG